MRSDRRDDSLPAGVGEEAPANGASPLLLSVVVVVYNMRREAARTLRSLMPGYQRGIAVDAYEVLVVENGSPEGLDPDFVAGCGANFRYLAAPNPAPSPASAVNHGLRQSRGALTAVMIDGARLASPGLLAGAINAAKLHPRAVAAAAGWHLGPAPQQVSAAQGYDQRREDRLLAAIGWPDKGDAYRLFEIAVPGGSAKQGIFRVPAESNFLCLPRALMLDELGGCDERFDLPGGGYLNPDLFYRACDLPDSELILLLGEGTFHQLHGGISTNPTAATPAKLAEKWLRQYKELRGHAFATHPRTPRFYGSLPPALAPAAEWSARLAAQLDRTEDHAARKRLIEVAQEQDAAARTEAQWWLLLGDFVPDEDSSADAKGDVPLSKENPARDRSRAGGLSWSRLRQRLPWNRRKKSAGKKTLLFCVNYRQHQGAHLKTWHYFQHARHSEEWEPRVYFDPETVWDRDNPWQGERAAALTEYVPEAAGALFIDGAHNWQRLPPALRENWPAPVVCTIQGFRHVNPYKNHRDYLCCRAVRICVSDQVRAALKGTGKVRGPTFVVPNAIDVPLLPAAADVENRRDTDLFIAGLKNPELATEIEARLRAEGWRVLANIARTPRETFLAQMGAADAALFLPRPKEGFYLPALEAMALRTRVVCPDVLGNRSFCREGVNSLRPDYTGEAILAACRKLRAQSAADREAMLDRASETAALHSLKQERKRFLRILANLPALWQE